MAGSEKDCSLPSMGGGRERPGKIKLFILSFKESEIGKSFEILDSLFEYNIMNWHSSKASANQEIS